MAIIDLYADLPCMLQQSFMEAFSAYEANYYKKTGVHLQSVISDAPHKKVDAEITIQKMENFIMEQGSLKKNKTSIVIGLLPIVLVWQNRGSRLCSECRWGNGNYRHDQKTHAKQKSAFPLFFEPLPLALKITQHTNYQIIWSQDGNFGTPLIVTAKKNRKKTSEDLLAFILSKAVGTLLSQRNFVSYRDDVVSSVIPINANLTRPDLDYYMSEDYRSIHSYLINTVTALSEAKYVE